MLQAFSLIPLSQPMWKALGKGCIPTSHSVSVCLYTPGSRGKPALEQAFSGSTEAGARGSAPKDQPKWLLSCIIGEPLSLEGSMQVSWSTSSPLTHGLAFHPPGQEPFTLPVNLTSYPATSSCLLLLGFPFPILYDFPAPLPPGFLGDSCSLCFSHHLTLFLGNRFRENRCWCCMPPFPLASGWWTGLLFANV